MRFHDTRTDPTAPLTPTLERLLGAIVAGAAGLESASAQCKELDVSIADSDPKMGLSVPHLLLNFKPAFINDQVRFWWANTFRRSLHSELLENTSSRFVWGVWEE